MQTRIITEYKPHRCFMYVTELFVSPAPTPAARPMIGRSFSWRALCEPGELARSPVFSVQSIR